MYTCDAHNKLRQCAAKTQSTNKIVTAGKLRNTYQNRKSSQVDYMISILKDYTRLEINGHQVDPRSDGILSVHFSLGELRQRQVKIVARALKELINTYFYVNKNQTLISYHNHPTNFRYKMSKGRKGGEAEPKPSQTTAPPPTAPPLGPPSTTPPPRSTSSGVTGNPTVAPGGQGAGGRNARAEALKDMQANAKREMAVAKDKESKESKESKEPKPEAAPKPTEAPFKPDGPAKFPPPKKGPENEAKDKAKEKTELEGDKPKDKSKIRTPTLYSTLSTELILKQELKKLIYWIFLAYTVSRCICVHMDRCEHN